MELVASETALHEDDDEPEAAKDFEDAIKACGFGVFNACLLLAAIPGLVASVFESLTMSFVMPSAECDLELTLMDKGALNGMTFAGAILSSIPFGFIADTFGRKYILVWGLFLLGCVTFCSSLSQSAYQLMIFKFLGGFLNSGPTAVFLSYISEFHGKDHRLQVLTIIGLLKALPTFLQPILAYVILPQNINFHIFGLKFTAWKAFIAISAIPAFLSSFLFTFFPESPKFLMSKGKNKKALEAFKTIYAVNTQRKKATYPITHLVDETLESSFEMQRHGEMPLCRSCQKRSQLITKFADGMKQIKPLCSPKYIGLVIVVFATYFALAFSVTPIRLWLPQYFATTKEMEFKGDNQTDTCHILEYIIHKADLIKGNSSTTKEKCQVHIESDSFINNMYTATALLVNFVLMTIAVRYAGNNFLLRINMAVACYSLISIYWSESESFTLMLACIFIAHGIVSITLILNISISAFPTTMRTMAVITLMSFGRFGGMLGNIMLPIFMRLHCSSMFSIYGAFILFSLTFSYFIPNTTKQNLK